MQAKVAKDGNGNPLPYQPEGGADYGDSEIGRSLRSVAQLIKMDLGMRVASVDFGGWDTHQGQGYYFPILVRQLSQAIGAFHNDTSKYHQKLTLVVQSEFGRRLKANPGGSADTTLALFVPTLDELGGRPWADAGMCTYRLGRHK